MQTTTRLFLRVQKDRKDIAMPNYEYTLMDEEIKKFQGFQARHRECGQDGRREILLEEVCAPTWFTIILSMTSIGMCPQAKCEVCNASESIACEERLESF